MKLVFALTLLFAVASCAEFNGIDKLNSIFTEQLRVQRVLQSYGQKFTLSFNSVVVFRQLVNQLQLTDRDLPAAQSFLEYIQYTYEIEDWFVRETVYPFEKRFQYFRSVYEVQDGLSPKQKDLADADIEKALEIIVKSREQITKYLNDKATELNQIQENVDKLKQTLVKIEKAASGHNDDLVKTAFEELKTASKEVLDLVHGKTVREDLITPIMNEIKLIDGTMDKLAKDLRVYITSIDF